MRVAPEHYRPDIDGLRTVAVLPVLLFHAGVPWMTGGFVGVDVFFVISGYLITSLILRDIEKGSFSVMRFYERRIRRILPALYVVVAGVLTLGLVMMLPSDLGRLGQSAAAVVVFGSNILFYSESGYFAVDAAYKPLLHTWSLAVEEQFYVVFPLVLGLLWKVTNRTGLRHSAVWAVLIASLLLCGLETPRHPEASFYLPFSRAWEFLLGSALALGMVPALTSRPVREAAAAAGLAGILFSVAAFGPGVAFPGWAALVPCLGAALLIHAGTSGGSLVTRFLSFGPMVGIGLISYSLYLWHWPLLVFARYPFGGEAPMWVSGAALGLSFVLAYLTWRFVERPFRDRQEVARRPLFIAAAAGSVLTAAVGAALWLAQGLPARLPDRVTTFDRGSQDFLDDRDRCGRVAPKAGSWDEFCRLGGTNGPAAPSFVLWGDSHADALRPAIGAAADRAGVSGVALISGGCPVLDGVGRKGAKSGRCARLTQAYLARVVADPKITLVVLASRWGLYANGDRYGAEREMNDEVVLFEGAPTGAGAADNPRLLALGLDRLVSKLTRAGKRVVLIGPVPEVGFDAPHALALAELYGTLAPTGPDRRAFEERQSVFFAIGRTLVHRYGVQIVWPHLTLCSNKRCRIAEEGRSLYVDDDHLSRVGAAELAAPFATVFDPPLPGPRTTDVDRP